MRQAARTKSRRGKVSRTHNSPAPVGGWNGRDGYTAMRDNEAVTLQNFFPSTSDVVLRKGMAAHATGITDGAAAQVETVVSYRPPSGAHSLWAFAGTKLFNVTAAGAVGAATVTGLTNARWQITNFTTAGGNFLLCVNGADDMQMYDGSTWTAINGASTPSITGVNTNTLVHVTVFKERVWYVQSGKLDVWYTGVGAFSGALTKFSLGSIFRNGGYLVAAGTWTLDGGRGIDDLMVFITSTGEVAVYQGTDPSSASTWALVGIFNVGAPIGRRCLYKYGGDLLIITQDGVVPASRAFAADRTSSAVAVSDKISGALGTAAELYSGTFGWQLTLHAKAGMLLLNVPISVGAQQQFVMNTATGAWCNFTGWNANCFEIHNDELYFGTLGEVRQAWTGTSDLGANIVGEAVGAFDYLGTPNALKAVRMIQPIIGWDSNPAEFLIGTDVDYQVQTPTGSISFASATGGVWDSGLWDGALWGGEVTLNKVWYTVTGVGYAIAPHLKVSSNAASVRWAATVILYESGGVL